MTAVEITLTQRLKVSHCPACHMAFAAPVEFWERLNRLHDQGGQPNWYCPAGHAIIHAGEGELDKVRRERDQLKQAQARLLDERADQLRGRLKAEAEVQRQAKRSAAGVCSCCHRTFKQLASHMRTKHPELALQQKGSAGGRARAAGMTPEQRHEFAKMGGARRWGHS